MDTSNSDKTALTSHHGLYRFIRMSIGLRHIPDTFQFTVDFILCGLKIRCSLVRRDETLVSQKRKQSASYTLAIL